MDLGKRHSAIIDALDLASTHTSVDIHVILTRNFLDINPLKKCQNWFHKLNLGEKSPSGGVLIYVNTRLKKIAIYGDEKIHKKVGQGFWSQTLRTFQNELRSTHYENAISNSLKQLALNLEHHLK